MKKFIIGVSAPTYNEIHNIDFFIKNILKLKRFYDIRLCFVDDQSTDGTKNKIYFYKNRYKFISVIERLKDHNKSQVYSAYHRGLLELYKNKKINYFTQLDTDNVCSYSNINTALKVITSNRNIDCVKLSKYLSKKKISRTFVRSFLSKFYTIICKLLFENNLTDYSTGIRFYNRKTVALLIFRNKLFYTPIGLLDDLLFLIKKKVNITEIGFDLKERKYGKSFFGFKVAFFMFIEFIYCIYVNLN
jgi:dolichol-phosphate mannosyltransferase